MEATLASAAPLPLYDMARYHLGWRTEHLAPLFVTLGAGDVAGQPLPTIIEGYWMGLSKRSIQVA